MGSRRTKPYMVCISPLELPEVDLYRNAQPLLKKEMGLWKDLEDIGLGGHGI